MTNDLKKGRNYSNIGRCFDLLDLTIIESGVLHGQGQILILTTDFNRWSCSILHNRLMRRSTRGDLRFFL
ncbi:unnamed protein product [Gordionus sp. m RMFG-2023]